MRSEIRSGINFLRTVFRAHWLVLDNFWCPGKLKVRIFRFSHFQKIHVDFETTRANPAVDLQPDRSPPPYGRFQKFQMFSKAESSYFFMIVFSERSTWVLRLYHDETDHMLSISWILQLYHGSSLRNCLKIHVDVRKMKVRTFTSPKTRNNNETQQT